VPTKHAHGALADANTRSILVGDTQQVLPMHHHNADQIDALHLLHSNTLAKTKVRASRINQLKCLFEPVIACECLQRYLELICEFRCINFALQFEEEILQPTANQVGASSLNEELELKISLSGGPPHPICTGQTG
jgi:hypothetical protein